MQPFPKVILHKFRANAGLLFIRRSWLKAWDVVSDLGQMVKANC